MIRLGKRDGLLAALVLGVMALGMTAWGADAAAAGEEAAKETMFSLIGKGGPVMIPIGLGSVIAFGIALERFISLRRGQVIPANFMARLNEAWGTERNSPDAAVRFCEEIDGAVGHIFKSALLRMHMSPEVVEKAVEDAGYREADKMKRSLRGLQIIAAVSPLLGLLGTVYGMIDAFQMATLRGVGGSGSAEMLAQGIYEALVTTAAGLTVAIPVLLVYQVLNAKVDRLIDELDEMGMEFMAMVMRPDPDGAKV